MIDLYLGILERKKMDLEDKYENMAYENMVHFIAESIDFSLKIPILGVNLGKIELKRSTLSYTSQTWQS